MKNIKLLLPGLIAAIAFIIVAGALVLQMHATNYSQFSLNGNSFNITYIAANQTSWEQGLMNKTIANKTTMLFAFPAPAIYPFWMLNTYQDLDIIWINASSGSGKIVYIAANATSCFEASKCAIYSPNKLANYVIEAKAGFVERNFVYVGENVSFT